MDFVVFLAQPRERMEEEQHGVAAPRGNKKKRHVTRTPRRKSSQKDKSNVPLNAPSNAGSSDALVASNACDLASATCRNNGDLVQKLVQAVHLDDAKAFQTLLERFVFVDPQTKQSGASNWQVDLNAPTSKGDVVLVEVCRYDRVHMLRGLLGLSQPKQEAQEAQGNDPTPQLLLNPNVESRNERRRQLTPIVASCMTLDERLVDLLLQHFNNPGQKENFVDLTRTTGGAGLSALMVLVSFSICNGSSDSQVRKALEILRKVLTYLKKHRKLTEILALKEKKNKQNVVQLAAAVANWQAFALFREFGVDLVQLGHAEGDSLVQNVERNAFNSRKVVARDISKKKSKQRGDRDTEPKSQADKEMETLSPRRSLLRSTEGFHVSQTLLEISKDTGLASLFVYKENGLRSIHLKGYLIANYGLVRLANEIASIPQATAEKKLRQDAFMSVVASFLHTALKDKRVMADLWTQALNKVPVFPVKPGGRPQVVGSSATDGGHQTRNNRRGKGRQKDRKPSPPTITEQQVQQHQEESPLEEKEEAKNITIHQLTPEAFQMIMNGLLSTATLPKSVKTWKVVLMELYELYSRDKIQPFVSSSQIANAEFYSMDFYRRIIRHIYRIARRMLFDVYCRPGHHYEDIDEEEEFRVLLASVEMFLQFFVIHARVLWTEHHATFASPVDLLNDLISPLDNLWLLLEEGLACVDGSMELPSRFSLVLFVLQVFDQIKARFNQAQDPDHALIQLYHLVANHTRKESLRRITDLRPMSDVQMLRTVANGLLPFSKEFESRVMKLKAPIHKLVESDPKILGLELASLTSIKDYFLLEHKVDYLSTIAEENTQSFHVSIARMTNANCLEFVLLQVMCASVREIRGEMDITLVHEPAVGTGVLREFFQLLSESFFNPDYVLPPEDTEEVKPHVNQIGAQWLQLVRQPPHFLHDQERFVREAARNRILDQAKEDYENREIQEITTGNEATDAGEMQLTIDDAEEDYQAIVEQVQEEIDSETRTARLLKSLPKTKVLSYKEQLCRMWPLFEFINPDGSRELRVRRRKPIVKRRVYEYHKQQAKSLDCSEQQHVVLSSKDFDEQSEKMSRFKELYRAIGRILGFAIRYEQPLGAFFPLAFWKFVLQQEETAWSKGRGKPRFKGGSKNPPPGSLKNAGNQDYPWEEYCEADDVFKRSLQFVLDHDFDKEPLDMRFEYTTDVEITDEEDPKPAMEGPNTEGDNAINVNEVVDCEEENDITCTPFSMPVEVLLSEELGNVPVTNANKHQYVYLRAVKNFFGEEKPLYESLRLGILDVITKQDLLLFSAEELQRVVHGNSNINVDLLKKVVEYTPPGITVNHPVVQEFWRVVETFDHKLMEKLLLFWSGSSIPPLFGFDSTYTSTTNLEKNAWTIELDTRSPVNQCPEANTCDRRLVLPRYDPLNLLKDRLRISLEFGATGYDRL